ncbi:Lrp/AsnC family transcriptional regulator [Veronia pacifica]|uniref:Transcriptional regulator n=1 Tax=Veronia pacifica TaxID=1080227 RepID=A0A1C3EKP8_9GAMM|nr:Lrp/AsnC family transcriptional regulator [Veronia pacifica]ODA33804.1 transcriptional regulator [Veronia pacifica]
MDNKDKLILEALQTNGRIAVSELAASLNMSDTPCLRRIRKLEQSGVITGYKGCVDETKLGYTVFIHAFVSLKNNSEAAGKAFEQEVSDIPHVMECSVIIGQHDYLLKVIAKDLAHYEQILKKQIANLDSIAKIESTIVLKSVFRRTTIAANQM